MAENILSIDTVALDEEKNALKIIDQTKLPTKIDVLCLTKQEDIYQAIRLLKVRGAPAIGVAAAIGVYLAALEIADDSYKGFYKKFKKAKNYLAGFVGFYRAMCVHVNGRVEHITAVLLVICGNVGAAASKAKAKRRL